MRYSLYRKGIGAKTVFAHRLVAFAFLGDPPDGRTYIDHINGVKTDNRPENLRWTSNYDNMIARYERNGTRRVFECPHCGGATVFAAPKRQKAALVAA